MLRLDPGKAGFRRVALAAVMAAAAALSVSVIAQPAGQPEKVEISEPTTPLLVSNLGSGERLNMPVAPANEDVLRYLNHNGESPAPAFIPLPANRPLTKEERRRIELEKNWAFATPDDLLPKVDPDDLLDVKEYGPDGLEKTSLDPVTRFFAAHGPSGMSNALQLLTALGAGRNNDFADTNAYNPDALSLGTNGAALMSLLSSNSPDASSLSTTETPDTSQGTMDDAVATQHKHDFEQLLGGPGTTSASSTTPVVPEFSLPGGSPVAADSMGPSVIPTMFGPGGNLLVVTPPVAPPSPPPPAPEANPFQAPVFQSPAMDDATRHVFQLNTIEITRPAVVNQSPRPQIPMGNWPYNLPSRTF
jgi:hypothetical protein